MRVRKSEKFFFHVAHFGNVTNTFTHILSPVEHFYRDGASGMIGVC